ncbi:hypothetical protein QAD02_020060 [Eretmocerus hayati]|uniref:Uncharacterized protein n=1 Tax=Eretmocerus hayati TaxID=131215 RepID=A0ACC2PMK6_9HYME|nr:hypothetical protein QAD02_020060 [Eretmocerus hayati]
MRKRHRHTKKLITEKSRIGKLGSATHDNTGLEFMIQYVFAKVNPSRTGQASVHRSQPLLLYEVRERGTKSRRGGGNGWRQTGARHPDATVSPRQSVPLRKLGMELISSKCKCASLVGFEIGPGCPRLYLVFARGKKTLNTSGIKIVHAFNVNPPSDPTKIGAVTSVLNLAVIVADLRKKYHSSSFFLLHCG